MINKILGFILLINLGNTQAQYYYKDTKCLFAYSIIREWKLNLFENGQYELSYSYKDTRNKKPAVQIIKGNWVFIGDTLKFNNTDSKSHDIYDGLYIKKNKNLHRVGLNYFLPDTLKNGEMPMW